ncbi:arf-GAP with Rho-GAP domain, ANK repeat and PH domain-containing protein 1 isoform X1 [Triplophysa dalaica]|uniref:arf-GAP with Rho-GAP domain, ANK repeat and PH domain-containing protein 1 isoform X1 n=3 Tax=Triplophysa dalaica TaxID=1582913 RepID=UPI0024DFCEAC|nr:arf-GAP with Rho-GAP domain, ANK repeat and PH domain-containing protein 1 isoform X1 [Triplophysa dalaica]
MAVKQQDLLRDMQKCFDQMKVEENKTETVSDRHRNESINIGCTEFPDNSEEVRSILKAGWLEKTPPNSGVIFQRRWVQLDSEYLRYFQSPKEVYSKRMISLRCVDKVVGVGDLKFQLHSQKRTFLFRADNTEEKNDWVCCLEKALSDNKNSIESRNLFFKRRSVDFSFEGSLELMSPRIKVYTIMSRDKLYLFKDCEEQFQGVGITDIDMRLALVKDGEKRSFTLTTPYRTFSFLAESESERQRWCDSLNECVSRSLSYDGVCESLWRVASNQQCADCSASMPEWASINLCVLLCEKCAGVHRSLGQNVSKVRSLKLDERVWTDDLIRVFLQLGNAKANTFWGANIPPSESLCVNANDEHRLQHITAKYVQGKYRKYHTLYGHQEELDSALCKAVQSADLLEILTLLHCGADIKCHTGIPEFPTPLSLAKRSGQSAQAELLTQNLNTAESFESVLKDVSIQSHCGYLFKPSSSSRPITEHKNKADFAQRWCCLEGGVFSYYKNDHSNKRGSMKTSEIICLSVNSPGKHVYEHTFELYTDEGRGYLFGADDANTVRNWSKAISMAMLPPALFNVCGPCDRLGRLRCVEGSHGIGWFCLSGFILHVLLENTVQTIDLRKLLSLTLSDSDGSMVLVWRGGTLHVPTDRRPHFVGWQTCIQQKSGSGDQPLSHQQLTELDVPVTVDRCLNHVTRHGLLSPGIYRKNGVNSHITELLKRFHNDARSVSWSELDFSVDDVANTLKRFLREVKDGVLNGQDNAKSWLNAAGLEDKSERIYQYQNLLSNLPIVNQATLKVLTHHLHSVQHLSNENQMTKKNLSIVFGPTLFQNDGKDVKATRVVEELIQNYCSIFNVSESELQRQLNLTTVALNKHKSERPSSKTTSSIICAVYLERIEEGLEVLVQVGANMTAVELVSEVLDHKEVKPTNEDFWSCYEILENVEMDRMLHYSEKVLTVYFSPVLKCNLLVKKNQYISSILKYLGMMENVGKSGTLRVCEVKTERSKNYCSRYCELSGTTFRLHKGLQNSPCEREWPVKELKVYNGYRSKLNSPTPWGITLVHEKRPWYLCCDNEDEFIEWTATFYSIQYDGDIWPSLLVMQSHNS